MRVLLAGLAFIIMVQYACIGLLVVPRLARLGGRNMLIRVGAVGAAIFFVGCAGTHFEIAYHALTDPTYVRSIAFHHIANHIPQVIGGWTFIVIAWRKLDLTIYQRGAVESVYLDTILNHTQSFITVKDLEGRYLLANENAKAFLSGFGTDDVIGKLDSEVLPYRLARRAWEEDRWILHTGQTQGYHEEIFDDQIFLVQRIPLRVEKELVGLCSIALEVTEIHRTREELERADRMTVTSQLARGVAHDFSHVLGLIKNYVRRVEKKTDDQAAEDINVIRVAIGQGESLARSLMRFSQSEEPNPTIFNLNDVLRGMELLVDFDTIDVVYELADDLWSIKADRSQIEQVIANLALNARDAMEGGGTLTIRTHNNVCHLHGECDTIGFFVCLTIEDTGEGIPPEHRERIFEPFFSTKDGNSSGLGLATVYGIVNRAGGTIEVDSKPGQTKFTVELPAGTAAQTAPTDEGG